MQDLLGYVLTGGLILLPIWILWIALSCHAIRRAMETRVRMLSEEFPFLKEHHDAVMERHAAWREREAGRVHAGKDFG
jgi:hypothetical protein